MTISLKFPDGKKQSFKKGVTPLEVAKGISEGLARSAVAAQLNDRKIDLDRPISEDGDFKLFTLRDDDGIEVLRHSCAHVLAQAVKRLYPKALPTIGPVIENGFMYDFDNLEISDEELPAIEAEMKKIIKEKFPTKRHDYKDAAEARKDYKDNKYKLEIIDEYQDGELSRYEQGEFHDLCRGPHCPHTGWPEAFALTRTAQAYWRGDSKNKQLARIYGLCFASKKELREYLEMMEEAAKRDHKKIGKEMGIYMIHELIGKGLPVWLPNGEVLKRQIEQFAIEMEAAYGYVRVATPHLGKKELFTKSGHLPHYEESMYPKMKMDDGEYYLKAMNCPFHHLVYLNESRSYRDLPIRMAEYGTCYRNELSGALSGLLRVRKMEMNDAHIYCRGDQVKDEIKAVIKLITEYYEVFGFENYYFRLSLWDSKNTDKYIGEKKHWENCQQELREVLQELKVKFVEEEGEAAFYGPKIDIQFKTVTGREESLSTVQLDFAAKDRFDLTYAGQDGKESKDVFVIHRAPLSTHERFIAFLIEHYAGKFPLWLSPEQIRILPIADRHHEYSSAVIKEMKAAGLRATLDDRALTTNKKVREAELARVNYILVVGDREVEAKTVNVRTRENKMVGEKKTSELVKELMKEASERQ